MPYVTPQQIERARSLDLLSYLQHYAPDELVQISSSTYCTKSHDSLKISHGKWYWWSEGIGGKSALDYLVYVRQIPFIEAVEHLCGSAPAFFHVKPSPPMEPPEFVLPTRARDNRRASAYLASRGIDYEIINHCIKHCLLYESVTRHGGQEYHNAVFVGYDGAAAKYAFLRGTSSNSTFMREAAGSDKRFSFSLLPKGDQCTLYLFESAIDLLSQATLLKMAGKVWRDYAYLSLGGLGPAKENAGTPALPKALQQYLHSKEQPQTIILCFDNDAVGHNAAKRICAALPDKTIRCEPPALGKDYNEMLQKKKRIAGRVAMRGVKREMER